MSTSLPGLHISRKIPWNEPVETFQFRFRSRHITAIGQAADNYHPNVRRLKIQPTLLDQVIKAILCLFPKFAQAYLRRWFPEWYLPSAIVLKSQKPDWEEEFDNELANYRSLQSLQGTVIPRHFGVVQFDGVRSHLMADVGGVCIPYTTETAEEAYAYIRKRLHESLTALASRGFVQDDVKLDNFHVVGNRVVVVDLERVERGRSLDEMSKFVESSIQILMQQYRNYLENLRARYP
ncbi:uncharacterized protein TRIREDRAFT_111937 [Trichoderma reesei QM6a]|uniref:Predicted protein n=2 Tax=Hypocrea jecorina TaxID=51453 RepID=G0RVT0_HYPJQ|nr:uncharacterized protein TRIREDRAFT_111937 [Trichoderma reesei QM6a]EGR44722.1 predicted protein [Trichoderma reesei QM6a]ETR97571.1 hypothetical protein M419DRAFT_91209 [Trichoderma reesei RUT C-30]